jgi:hypothetical protein
MYPRRLSLRRAGFAVLACGWVLSGCADRPRIASLDASVDSALGDVDGQGEVGATDLGGEGAGSCSPAGAIANDASAVAPFDGGTFLPPNLTAPPPPSICCDVNAARGCDLPPSTCAVVAGVDASPYTAWIVYYENPRCLDGLCVWDQSYFQCLSSDICVRGACLFPGTAVP